MRKLIILLSFLFIVGCASVQPKFQYNQTADELEQELRNDNLTPVQRVVIKHAIAELKGAAKMTEENAKLQKKLVAESKDAGAGVLVKWLIGLAFLIVAAFIVTKIKGIF